MNNFIQETLFLVTIINPIGIFMYLAPVRQNLSERDFLRVLFKATIISLSINLIFTFGGEWMFRTMLKIDFNSFRIFGGIVLLSISLMSIIHGGRALINIRGSLDDLASEIAMPFMTGVGTISVCILLGSKMSVSGAAAANLTAAAVAFTVVGTLAVIRYHLSDRITIAFDKILGIFIRINGFFMGAFGVEMIKTGILNIIRS